MVGSSSDSLLPLAERDEIERAFERLTQDQRTILTLVYFADLSLADAALALGIPIGTTKSRLHNALIALRAALAAADRVPGLTGGVGMSTMDRPVTPDELERQLRSWMDSQHERRRPDGRVRLDRRRHPGHPPAARGSSSVAARGDLHRRSQRSYLAWRATAVGLAVLLLILAVVAVGLVAGRLARLTPTPRTLSGLISPDRTAPVNRGDSRAARDHHLGGRANSRRRRHEWRRERLGVDLRSGDRDVWPEDPDAGVAPGCFGDNAARRDRADRRRTTVSARSTGRHGRAVRPQVRHVLPDRLDGPRTRRPHRDDAQRRPSAHRRRNGHDRGTRQWPRRRPDGDGDRRDLRPDDGTVRLVDCRWSRGGRGMPPRSSPTVAS